MEHKNKETVAEMLLRLLRGHGHIFNKYELGVLGKDSSSKGVIETYTQFKDLKKAEKAGKKD